MKIKDSLQLLHFIENLLIEEGGQSITDIQRHIIEDLLEGKTYKEIADSNGYDEKHIGDVSRNKIFKVLSKQLGLEEKDVNKSNFRWIIEKAINTQLLALNSNNNYCVNSPQPDTIQPTENKQQSPEATSYHDLSLAPKKISNFGDRLFEIETLTERILTQKKPLISVLGLSGIGKTTLVRHFVDLNLENFEVVIWKNLKLSNSLDGIITDILTNINADLKLNENNLPQFLELLKTKKCLIIFDNFQELFISGKVAGQFKPEYQDYQNFLKMITEVNHQSSLILISQEQCHQMLCLDEELYPVKCLELEGLYNNEFLQKLGLKDQESWSNLINLYEGNPFYLKDIANLINNIFDGKVANFLAENSSTDMLPEKNSGTGILPVITNNMRSHFNKLFDRLSPLEHQISLELSKFEQPVSREELRQNLGLSLQDLFNGLQSLQHRFLASSARSLTLYFSKKHPLKSV